MDATQKTEKISAPSGKHDDYCDSSVLGIHGTLSMLPAEGSFTGINVSKQGTRAVRRGSYSGAPLITTGRRRSMPSKGIMRNL
jgi:hypothetical protein